MMEVESPTYFRSTSAIPLKSPTNSGIHPLTPPSIDSKHKYNFGRSKSYAENISNMVVESQTHNFLPLTPDPLPETAEKIGSTCTDILRKRHQTLSLPPEGAVTTSPEPQAKKSRLQLLNSNCESEKDRKDFLEIRTKSNFPTESAEMLDKKQTEFHTNSNSLVMAAVEAKDFMQSSDDTESEDSMQLPEKRQTLSESLPLKNTESLLEAAFKVGLDRSPPTLSPDTDFDVASTGSPSVNGERRRRKPNLEDIVRRMKEVETDYYSDDSEEEAAMDTREMIDGGDEIDGDFSSRMPLLTSHMGLENGKHNEIMSNMKLGSNLTENNNIIEKSADQKDSDSNKAATDKVDDESDDSDEGIPLPPSSKADFLGTSPGDYTFKQPGRATSSPKMNGWLHGAFNGSFPMFPFHPNPQELPFSNFMSPFENKFPSSEVEKDYLKCQYCERTFRRQKNLENHIENTHQGKSQLRKKTGENGDQMYFKCTHCPYTTKHQSNLYVHLRIHTGERPYICGACGVQYSQSHSLKSHIINKHDGIMSYYIKEKRTRSPRGLGYLAHCATSDSPIFKMPSSPMILPNLPQLPSHQNNLPIQHSPHHQNMSLQLSPHHPPAAANLHSNQSLGVPRSPMMSPNHLHIPPSQISPGHPAQLSPQQQLSPRQPVLPHMSQMPHFPERLDMMQKSKELAKLGIPYLPLMGNPLHAGKPSPPFHMNGHGPISPQYNGLSLQMKQHMEQIEQIQRWEREREQVFLKNNVPLQEIHENNKVPGEADGAIDLTKKKLKKEVMDIAMQERAQKCLEGGENCPNCLHLMKLRMLRMNVVRMLGILVPNLNFEEKGINAEGDSVDDLLRDVIESNMHEEEMKE